MKDRYRRTINYMRLSITDRCNLRCRYCMPDGLPEKLPMKALLSYEELLEVAKAAAELGITRFKVTGGEPLVRLGAEDFIGALKKLPGVEQVTMTSNGILLREKLPALLSAGLDAVNISLDTLQEERYREITGFSELPRVLAGIEAALSAGLRVKLNTVLQRGVNDGEWRELAELAKWYPLDVRFIEMMPIGHGKQYEAIYNEELEERLRALYPELGEDHSEHGNGPARYVKVPGFSGSIGFISAMHGKFCAQCNRVRLTSTGKLKPCLCYGESMDLLPILRGDMKDAVVRGEALRGALSEAIRRKPEAHCFEQPSAVTEEKEMISIGG